MGPALGCQEHSTGTAEDRGPSRLGAVRLGRPVARSGCVQRAAPAQPPAPWWPDAPQPLARHRKGAPPRADSILHKGRPNRALLGQGDRAGGGEKGANGDCVSGSRRAPRRLTHPPSTTGVRKRERWGGKRPWGPADPQQHARSGASKGAMGGGERAAGLGRRRGCGGALSSITRLHWPAPPPGHQPAARRKWRPSDMSRQRENQKEQTQPSTTHLHLQAGVDEPRTAVAAKAVSHHSHLFIDAHALGHTLDTGVRRQAQWRRRAGAPTGEKTLTPLRPPPFTASAFASMHHVWLTTPHRPPPSTSPRQGRQGSYSLPT